MVIVIALLVVAVLVIWVLATYNGLVRRRNRTREAWSQIDVELKRRHDLIPNLVETVRGYAAHERQTFMAVTTARARAVGAGAEGNAAEVARAENALTTALRSLFAVAENYPQLRAVQSYLQLQEQLTACEDKLEFARRYYNTSTRDYDNALQVFPGNLVARPFSFVPALYFEAAAEDRSVPRVVFPGSDTVARPTG
jgi:LemA protein